MFKKCKITSYINGQWARALSKISEIDERYSKKCMILYIYNKSKAIKLFTIDVINIQYQYFSNK